MCFQKVKTLLVNVYSVNAYFREVKRAAVAQSPTIFIRFDMDFMGVLLMRFSDDLLK